MYCCSEVCNLCQTSTYVISPAQGNVFVQTIPVGHKLLYVIDSGARWSCGRSSGFRSKGPGFKTTCCCFKIWAISFTPLCLCLLEETVKAVGASYLVSMPGEVKDSTQGNGKKPVVDSVLLRELVISVSKLTILPPSLAVISCKGSTLSSKQDI